MSGASWRRRSGPRVLDGSARRPGPARSRRQGARWQAPRISELRGPTRVRHIGCRSRCCQRFLLRLRRALLVPTARAAGR